MRPAPAATFGLLPGLAAVRIAAVVIVHRAARVLPSGCFDAVPALAIFAALHNAKGSDKKRWLEFNC